MEKSEIKKIMKEAANEGSGTYCYRGDVIEELARMALKTAGYEENIEYILKTTPGAVRVREGGGPEDLNASLAVTLAATNREWPHGRPTVKAANPLPTFDTTPNTGRSAGFLLYCHIYEARWAALNTAEYCPKWDAIPAEIRAQWEILAGNIATEVARK